MDWSLRKVFSFTMSPGHCVVSAPFPDETDAVQRKVNWVSGKRVGVIVQGEDRSWRVAWFSPPKSKRRGDVPLLVGGSSECDLNSADVVEALSEEQLKRLGLNEWKALED
jgi:hypothetical protein